MQKDYFYKPEKGTDFDLGSGFAVSTTIGPENYLVSNVKEAKAEIFAPEINFYFEKSLDPLDVKIRNLKKLYELRALTYECAQDVESSVRVGKTVLLISKDNPAEIIDEIKACGFTVKRLVPHGLSTLTGSLGQFTVESQSEDGVSVSIGAQVVWCSAPENQTQRVGVFDPDIIGTEETVKQLQFHEGLFRYQNTIKYDWSLCLQNNKHEKVCQKCREVCPQAAISMDMDGKKPVLSHIQCVGCGQCVSICPTGALDYAPMPRNSFDRLASFFAGSIALIFTQRSQIEDFNVTLAPKVLPLVVEDSGFLDEDYLLSLIYISGHPVFICTPELSKPQRAVISFINTIFDKVYGLQGVYVCHDPEQVSVAMHGIVPFDFEHDQNVEGEMAKRQRVSTLLSHLLVDKSFGVIKPGNYLPFGDISINQNRCTLCLSCVDACSTGALVANSDDNTLRCTPSLCVQCGYCEMTCPEADCLSVVYNELRLEESYFQPAILAQDELFSCIECGKGFAPSKSIEKIIQLMTPQFGNDPLRIKTLSCCPDCKAKVMLESIEAPI